MCLCACACVGKMVELGVLKAQHQFPLLRHNPENHTDWTIKTWRCYRTVRDSSVGIATRYGLDGPGLEFRWGAIFSAPVQTGPGGPPNIHYSGYRVFPVGKSGLSVALTTHPIAEVKERVELYLYSHYGPSWPVLSWPLPLPLPSTCPVVKRPRCGFHHLSPLTRLKKE
jgi:hypothetical protein